MFPDRCLRGLRREQLVEPDGMVKTEAFSFQGSCANSDGILELSVNWDDCASALEFTRTQRDEDGTIQFPAGVAAIETSELERLRKAPVCANCFSYERAPIGGVNEYHGNLLLNPRPEMTNERRRRIAADLANRAVFLGPPQTGDPEAGA